MTRFSRPVCSLSTAECCPVRLIAARTFAGSRTTSYPATMTCPASGRDSVVSIRTVVVLPAPFGPSSAKTDPAGTCRSIPARTTVDPKAFRRPVTSTVDLLVEEKFALVMGLVTYVQGAYRLQIELAEGYAENPAAFSRDYAAGLRKVVDPQQLGKLVAAGVFDAPDGYDADSADEFDFGLSVYLDGVAARIERATTR
jgi:hypothetical protein